MVVCTAFKSAILLFLVFLLTFTFLACKKCSIGIVIGLSSNILITTFVIVIPLHCS